MLLNSIVLGLNFLFLLLFLFFVVKKNRKLSEEKANLELKLERELQEAKRTLLNKDEEIVGLKVKKAELEVILVCRRDTKTVQKRTS